MIEYEEKQTQKKTYTERMRKLDKEKPREGDFNPYFEKTKKRKNKNKYNLFIILLIILPLILCLVLFAKVNSLQKQVDLLMIDQYGMTYSDMGSKKDSIVHAGNINNQEDKEKESDKKPDIQEETKDSTEDHTQNKEPSEEAPDESTGEDDGQDDPIEKPTDTEKGNGQEEPTEDPTEETPANEETEEVDQGQERKKVYLTFDDGPSKNTAKVLDILKKYDVKATFFVLGQTDDFSLKMYKRIIDEGHTIGLHSYTHSYDYIYSSVENFKSDLFKLRDLIYDTTGHKPDIYRFPGGSSNQVSKLDISVFIKFLEENNITYYDWNVVNGDATGQKITAKEAYDNTINGVKLFDSSYVLMHDAHNKDVTVESLPKILEALIEKDVEFLLLSKEVKPWQQVKVEEIMSR